MKTVAIPWPYLRSKALRLAEVSVEMSPWRGRCLLRLPFAANHVALTFDDGPDPELTPQILDILDRHGARATFFLLGRSVARHGTLVRSIVAAGHAVGNHTYTHLPCHTLSLKELKEELDNTDIAIRSACPEADPTLFRPPWGKLRFSQIRAVLRDGRRIVWWNRDTKDFRASQEEVRAVAGGAHSRDIVLMHDRRTATVGALPDILRTLRSRGLRTITL